MARPSRGLRLACTIVCLCLAQPLAAQGESDESALTNDHLIDFPLESGRNFVSLFSEDNLVPFLVGGAAGSAVIGADDGIVRYFDTEGRLDGFDTVGRELGKSQFIGPALGVTLLASRATKNQDFRELSYTLAQGYIVTNILTGSLKKITQRNRPGRTSTDSFPSRHTPNSFAWATIARRRYGWEVGAPDGCKVASITSRT